MNLSTSRIAMLSGMCSSAGLAPHLLFMLVLFTLGHPAPLVFLFPTYLASIFFGEYLFFTKTGLGTTFVGWLKCVLHLRDPGYLLWAYVSEISFDGIFLYLALKFQWDPLHFFLLFLGCKCIAAPIQTYVSSFFLSKNISFTLAVGSPVLLLIFGDKSPELFLYALILKGVLCNGIAVARSQYASEITSQNLG